MLCCGPLFAVASLCVVRCILLGPGTPSCATACPKLNSAAGRAFQCDEVLLMRLNACNVADIAHLFDLAQGIMQPMLDGAAKACVGGYGGFNAAVSSNPGDGPGFSQSHASGDAGREKYRVILHRFLGCENKAASGTKLLCPCTIKQDVS